MFANLFQALLSLVFLALCSIVNMTFLVLRQRNTRLNKDNQTKSHLSRNKNTSASVKIEEEEEEELLKEKLLPGNHFNPFYTPPVLKKRIVL